MSMWWASVVSAMSGASLASFAIRSSFVETVVELDVSVIFPSYGSVTRRRPLLDRVPRTVPLLPRSYCGAPTSRRPSRPASLPSRARYRRHSAAGDDGISQVSGEPFPCVPCSQTPAGPLRQTIGRSALPLQRSGVVFRAFHGVDSRNLVSFGAPSHGPHARCLRFAAAVARGPRKTRFRLVVLLGRTGFEPAGSHREVSVRSRCYMTSSS